MKQKALSALLYLIALMPFWLIFKVSDLFYYILYYIVRYRKNVIFDNLRNSFPEKSEEEIRAIAKKFYRFFPDLILECLKFKRISKDEVSRRLTLVDEHELTRHLDQNKTVIAATAHYANWEYGIHGLSTITDAPTLIVYKPLNNKTVDQVYNQVRTRFGAVMVPMKQIVRHLVKLRGKPSVSVFVADQAPTYSDSDYFLQFLNQETLVYTGLERISKMTNGPIVYCHIGRKEKRGYYFCKFTTLIEDPSAYSDKEITHIYNAFTENIIREEPQYWLWSHKRWKRKRRK
ncbi:lysophospholipid acyltransferase family protein [Sphingobacterium sp. SG20118]|uniref:lysophospholipid acyltransferase family protein n=1 Tax=Sphingobacterium TaxID=28453 RepID=UPI0004F59EC5|nr:MULTISPECIES: lysophospholipid acyltransferase family protein [Sphingobacterium]AIM36506.1 lauroyl acyltransferase [Sphingobacterium sp. ML3W]MDH5827351.1 lysophospholipid acyltransferase family protein [Sphingobacterium faecium]